MTAKVLVLGGTAEATALVATLQKRSDVTPILSLAGATRAPTVPNAAVRIGGFGGADGLAEYLTSEDIAAVIDATHPFAAQISANAKAACSKAEIPLRALVRPAWTPVENDDWRPYPDATAAAEALPPGARAFLALGAQRLAPFSDRHDVWFLVRTVDPLPSPPLPGPHAAITGRGPFNEPEERALLRHHRISHVVSRNSGGRGARAKLDAARALALPVLMIERPPQPDGPTATTVDEAIAWLMTALA